jgi:hypothetical protein
VRRAAFFWVPFLLLLFFGQAKKRKIDPFMLSVVLHYQIMIKPGRPKTRSMNHTQSSSRASILKNQHGIRDLTVSPRARKILRKIESFNSTTKEELNKIKKNNLVSLLQRFSHINPICNLNAH